MQKMRECESLENYLKQILILLETKGYARSKDIAESLGVTKPTVCVAMKKLKEDGYIMMKDRSPVYLTDKGYSIARQFYDRYKALTSLLIQLGVDEQTAAEDACRLEHDLSEQSFAAITGLLAREA
jgi:Mn-dependent DtxR family transcriptional regulator